jgi:hypothetical protein
MRRFTRLTKCFLKKGGKPRAFRRTSLHLLQFLSDSSLRVTPAMEAGATDHVWSLEEVIALLDNPPGR